MAKPKKITEKVMLAAVKACADEYIRIVAKSPRGVPDCLVRYRGHTFFVEVKTETDKASATQINFISKFESVIIWPNKIHTSPWPCHIAVAFAEKVLERLA